MAFQHFLSTSVEESLPFWWQARAFSVSPEISWENHARSVQLLKNTTPSIDSRPEFSLLDLKIALADQIFDSCDLCPHDCRVNRNAGKKGYCLSDAQIYVHFEGVLHGEEIELVPSHETFLSGCTMRCAFCYSHEHIENAQSGQAISPKELANCIGGRKNEGATNWNIVGGEPTVHLPNILRALREMESPQAVVWNSNMYFMPRASELLDGIADVFLGDIHFGNNHCARKVGRIPRYFESVTTSIQYAAQSGADVVIRHLAMPGHMECCARPAMEWARENLPNVPFHLMFQYLPDYRANGDKILGRPLSQFEIAKLQEMAQEIGVNLYQNTPRESKTPINTAPALVGETMDIVIHDDGRVSFTRLEGSMLQIMQVLEGSALVQGE